jgi:hypothetical protein
MSKNILVALAMLSFGCFGRGTVDVEPGCRCAGEVPSGHLEAACGSFACVGGVGYLCTDVNAAAEDPRGCMMPPDPVDPPPPSALPGEVSLEVTDAEWFEGELYVAIVLANGAGNEPASLNPGFFDLETNGGAVVGTSGSYYATCGDGDVSVAAGAALGCTLAYELPPGHDPLRVLYSWHEAMASAPIPLCGASSPHGLCPVDLLCDGTDCVAPCSPENLSGPCEGDALCLEGYCRPRCSAEEPTGYCDEGGCSNGVCDPACWTMNYVDDCYTCLESLIRSNSCNYLGWGGPSCAEPGNCADCFLSDSGSSCACPEMPACDGCEAEVQANIDCLERECPACVR